MAYSILNPPGMIAQRVGASGGAVWVYTDGDDLSTVTAINYVSNATDLGLVAGDRVIHVDSTKGICTDLCAVSGATTGTAVGATTSAVEPIGETSIALGSAGTGTVLVGDIVTFSGANAVAGTEYLITTGDADISGGATLVITPALVAAIAIGDKMTIKSDVVNLSGTSQELTASAAVNPGSSSVELNHATVVVAAVIADATKHEGLFVVVDTSASGTAAHTLTLTSGTFNGTNNVATLNAPKECLAVWFDSAGNGTILENVGSVGLS